MYKSGECLVAKVCDAREADGAKVHHLVLVLVLDSDTGILYIADWMLLTSIVRMGVPITSWVCQSHHPPVT